MDRRTPNKGFQPRRGDIFFADLSNISSKRGCRPVIVIQNDIGNINSSTVIVATITSSHKKQLPTHISLDRRHGLKKPSVATLEDILTINKSCLINYLGTVINTDAEKQLDRSIRISLGLP